MKIAGGGNVHEVGPEDEGPHPVGAQGLWQESVVLVWWDRARGVGGFHRIGHEPNRDDGPHCTLWNNLWAPGRMYKRTATIPLRDSDRSNGFNCGDDTCRFEYRDHAIWRIRDQGIDAELHVHDSHTPVDIYPKKGTLGEDIAPNHMEVGGRVSGHLQIDGQRYEVDGLAFRDHGWGMRDWSAFISHRWIAGSFEDGSMLLALTFHGVDDRLVGFGCVIRNGELTYARQVDVLLRLEADGLTHRGATLTMPLTTGEILQFDCRPLAKGAVSWIHGIACVDTICELEFDGVRGICDVESTNNALRGAQPPRLAVNGIVDNGLHVLT